MYMAIYCDHVVLKLKKKAYRSTDVTNGVCKINGTKRGYNKLSVARGHEANKISGAN